MDIAGARGIISCAQAGIGIVAEALFGLHVIVNRVGQAPALEVNLSGFS